MTYLTSAHAKDDSLYPKDIVKRAIVDQRLSFDLGTLYQRMYNYFVSKFALKKNRVKYGIHTMEYCENEWF